MDTTLLSLKLSQGDRAIYGNTLVQFFVRTLLGGGGAENTKVGEENGERRKERKKDRGERRERERKGWGEEEGEGETPVVLLVSAGQL